MEQRFFGLGNSNRPLIFKEIHEIVFHGQGGYDWLTVYNMPIWLRKYTFNEIRNFYEKKNNIESGDNVEKSIAAMKSAGATASNQPSNKIQIPSFITKASKK